MNYLITGSSFKLIDVEIKKILKEKKYNSFSLEDVPIKDILEDLSYDSMFQEEKILLIKNLEVLQGSKKEQEKNREALLNYLNNPNECTTIIFLSKEKLGTRSTLKEIVKKLKVIDTPIINKPYELAKILNEPLKERNLSMSAHLLDIFVEKCACNYDIAINELDKLKSYLGDNRNVTESDIENYVSNYNTVDQFGFKDAVINKNIEKSFKMLDDLENSKVEIVPIVVMLAKEYMAIYNIKLYAKDGISNDTIGTEMNNMHPFRVKLLREAGNKYTLEDLEKIICYLCNLDLALVSRDNLGFDELRKFLLII